MRVDEGMGYALGGFELSGTDEEGVQWKTLDVEDWWAAASTTNQAVQNLLADGGWLPPSQLEPKALRLVGRFFAPDRPAGRRAALRFNNALPSRAPVPLVVSEDGVVCHRLVVVEGVPSLPRPTDVYAAFDVQLVASDPRLLGGDGSSPYQFQGEAFLPVASGGLRLPTVVPFSIGATVVSGSVTVTATGNAQPPVLIRINGPAVSPIIRDEDGGSMPLNISLDAGQWLDVDLDARTIKLNGTVSRRNLLRGRWITPRSGMVLSLDAAVYDPLTSMTVHWTDASF